jgi:ketosteroid isomerase-like protein
MITAEATHAAHAETAIRAVLDGHAAAHAARDVERLRATYTDDAVCYVLAPPLQQGPETAYGTPEGLRAWFATFDGPVRITYRDPVVTTDGNVAFVHCLTSMTATPAGTGEPFTLWYRSSFGLRRLEGAAWRITHRHDSTPFYMDGTFRAAVDLQP